jgi:hypothetical protein
MTTIRITLTGAIAAVAAICFLGSTTAWAQGQGQGGRDIEATELDCENPCVDSAEIEDGAVTESDLGFDTATQAELDSHAGDPDAHHVPTGGAATECAFGEVFVADGTGDGTCVPLEAVARFGAGLSECPCDIVGGIVTDIPNSPVAVPGDFECQTLDTVDNQTVNLFTNEGGFFMRYQIARSGSAYFCHDPLDPPTGVFTEEETENILGQTQWDDCVLDVLAAASLVGVSCPEPPSVTVFPVATSVRTVFTTANTYTGDLAFAGSGVDGLEGADNLCQDAADTAGLPAGEYVAFLSTSTVNARDRLPPNSFGYVLPDGITMIATGRADLLDGGISHAIDQDELNNPIPPGGCLEEGCVWTSSYPDGTTRWPPPIYGAVRSCDEWTSDDGTGAYYGGVGRPVLTDSGWTDVGIVECDEPQHLYCVQQ